MYIILAFRYFPDLSERSFGKLSSYVFWLSCIMSFNNYVYIFRTEIPISLFKTFISLSSHLSQSYLCTLFSFMIFYPFLTDLSFLLTFLSFPPLILQSFLSPHCPTLTCTPIFSIPTRPSTRLNRKKKPWFNIIYSHNMKGTRQHLNNLRDFYS